MKYIKITIPLLILFGCTHEQVQQAVKVVTESTSSTNELTTSEVASGLKQALKQGVSKGSDQASQLDGYFKNELLKIAFPPEVIKVENTLRDMGFNKLVDDFVLSMNRAAEDAAAKAKPIFVDAITSMTIQDAWDILKGSDDAATQYLKKTTTAKLTSEFQPVIQNSLKEVGATKYYSEVIGTYNKIPLVEDVNPDLDAYVTEKAIDGLFVLVEKEEANIRENPTARATDLLKKVFNKDNWTN